MSRSLGTNFWVRLAPLIFFQVYLNFTVVAFEFSPWPWPVDNKATLYLYLIAAHVALAIGYALATMKQWQFPVPKPGYVSGLFIASLALSLLLALPTSLSRTGVPIPDVLGGLSDPGEAYGHAVLLRQSGGEHVVVEYMRIGVAPLLALLLPLLVVYWSAVAGWKRVLGALAVAWLLGLFIATGTNKGVADFVLILPWLVLLRYFALKRGRLPVFRFSVVVALSFIVMIIFFAYGQVTREGGGAIASVFGAPLYIYADPEHWLTSTLPDDVRIAVESLLRYLNAGYYALSRCLTFGFDWTYGVGNSMFLSRNFDAIFDTHITDSQTYPAKLESAEAWGVFALWHSVYPWLASDFGFPGTLIVVGFVGWLLGAAWISALESCHPAAISLFSYLCIAVYYFPANNQLMQSGESCVGFLLTAGWWALALVHHRLAPVLRGSGGRSAQPA